MSLPAINPSTLFDVRGKSAVVVGATGAFGQVACTTLGRAGARLTIAAGNAAELESLARELAAAGIEAHAVARRSNDEAGAAAIVEAAVAAHGGIDILVVASGMNDVSRGASETDSASGQVLSSAKTVSQVSSRLKTEVERFLSTVQAA